MPMKDRPRSALLDIPEPDRLIKAATGQGASIWAPDHAMHPVRMPRERLETVSTGHVPQLDRAITARARELCAIRCKSQACHPIGMSREYLYAGVRPWHLGLPYPNAPIGATTGE